MRIGVCQLRCPAGDDAARADAIEAAIHEAADGGADLIILPELAACGYLLDPDHLSARSEPGDGSGLVLSAWRQLAATLGVSIIGGYAERTDRGIANAAVVIDDTGEIAGSYRKVHRFGAEHEQFIAGDLGLPVFEIGGEKVGVLICYDLRFPESARILALRGAALIAVPTAWVGGFDIAPAGRSIGQVDGVLVQANLSQVFIACADQVGREGDVHFLGRSLVADPYGRPALGPLPEDGDQVAVVDVDLDTARAAQERGDGISPRDNRRTDVYGALLGYAGDPG